MVKITPIEKLIIGNGAGIIKDIAGVQNACGSEVATRVTAGAGTVPYTRGNIAAIAEGTYYVHPVELWAMNALGLPNPGEDEWRVRLPKMVDITHGAGKLLGFNASGSAPEQYGTLARMAHECHVDYIQLNLSCANVWGPGGVNKAIAAENPDLVEAILQNVRDALPLQATLEVEAKVAPNHDPKLIAELCEIFAASDIVTRVVVANARGGQKRMRQDGKTPALAFRAGDDETVINTGAESGSVLTENTPKLVEAYYNRLPEAIGIIALGGIFNGSNAWASIKRGAVGFECTTSYDHFGHRILGSIVEGLSDEYPDQLAA